MPLQQIVNIFLVLFIIGTLAAIFVLIRYRNPLLKIIINIFGLIIWVPFWLLDKYFKLNIFENKK